MQARVFHIHEAPVTLCPLIYKAQCSAESVPPGPPIKFNGLSAMTSKSLVARFFANSSSVLSLCQHAPFFISACNTLTVKIHECSARRTEACVVYMQSLWFSKKKKKKEIFFKMSFKFHSLLEVKLLQTNQCTAPSGGAVSPPRGALHLRRLPSAGRMHQGGFCLAASEATHILITRPHPASSLKHVNIKRG